MNSTLAESTRPSTFTALGVNSALLAAGAYIAQGATVVAYVVAARYLTPSQFGVILAGLGVESVLLVSADFGLNAWTVRHIAAGGAPSTFKDTLAAKILLSLVLGCGWLLIAGFLFAGSPSLLPMVLMSPYLVIAILATTFAVPFRAAERMGVVAAVGGLEKITAMAATIGLFIAGVHNGVALVAGLCLGSSFALITYIVLVEEGYRRFQLTSGLQIGRMWRASLGFGVFGLAVYIQRIDTAIVAVAAGPVAAGVYGVPARLANLLSVLPSSFSLAVFSRASRNKKGQSVKREALLSGATMYLLVLLVLGCVFVLAPTAVKLLVGSQYAESVVVLRVYVFAIALGAANQPLASWLQAKQDETAAARILVVSDVLGLSAVAAGAALSGAIGAAVGSVLLQAFIAVGLTMRVFRLPGPTRGVKRLARHIVGVGAPND